MKIKITLKNLISWVFNKRFRLVCGTFYRMLRLQYLWGVAQKTGSMRHMRYIAEVLLKEQTHE